MRKGLKAGIEIFLVIFSNCQIVPVVKEKGKVKLPIFTGAPTTFVDEMIGTPPYAALKAIKILSM